MKKIYKTIFAFMLIIACLAFSAGIIGCEDNSNETEKKPDTDKPSAELIPTEGLVYEKVSRRNEYSCVYIGDTKETQIVIAAEYDGFPVTKIGYEAFDNCTEITSIIIPDSVKEIEYSAFRNCKKLTSLKIPEKVTKINNYTFDGCEKLRYVTMSDNVTEIGNGAFRNCSFMSTAPIGKNVTSIGREAFFGCNGFTSITIPDNVIEIGESAFSDCPEVKTVILGTGLQIIGSRAFYTRSYLPVINYNGTMAQWHMVTKGAAWSYYSNATVSCSNGDIKLNG